EPPLDLFQLVHGLAQDGALLLAGVVHHFLQLRHHAVFGLGAGVHPGGGAIAPVTAVTAHAVTLAAPVAGAALIAAAALHLPVTGLAVTVAVFQHGDLVDVLDGIGELVDGFQVASGHFGLHGQLFQLSAQVLFDFLQIFFRLTVAVLPRGTRTKVATLTLNSSLTAAGVTVAVASPCASPSMAIAMEIAPAVPPAGTAIFPLKITRYLAKHCPLDGPLSWTTPAPSR